MKRSVLFLFLLIGLNFGAQSQITKPAVEQMLIEVGTSMDSIKLLFIGNTTQFFDDGSIKRGFSRYEAANGNTFALVDNGIKGIYSVEGVIKATHLYPFDNIGIIDVGIDYINIYLRD